MNTTDFFTEDCPLMIEEGRLGHTLVSMPSSGSYSSIESWRLEDHSQALKGWRVIFSAYYGFCSEYDPVNKLNAIHLAMFTEDLDEDCDHWNCISVGGYELLVANKLTYEIESVIDSIISTHDYLILDDEVFDICIECSCGIDLREEEVEYTDQGTLCQDCSNDVNS